MKFISKSPVQTQKIASELAHKIVKSGVKNRAKVLALKGELGAGKTTFVKGFAKALGLKVKISSPTFVIMKSFQLQASSFKNLYHIDAYRLKDEKELKKLDIEEVFSKPENIVLIEWSDRVKKILPQKRILIHIDHVDENTRRILITT